MHRQVGDLVIDDSGIARKGLLVRHLVLPRGMAGTGEIMGFIAGRISTNTYVNIMPQYRPCGRAAEVDGLEGYPSRGDFEAALTAARDAGITRLDEPRRIFMMA
jgi:putative pyruvate formate lyase activating enzyme